MSLFEKVLVKKPKRSRLDFTHGNSVSMRFGMLTPTECRFIVPGDDVAVSMEQIVRLSPMPVPTFVNMKVRHDWFFVPLSMMYDQRSMDLLLGSQSSRNRARVAGIGAYQKIFAPYTSPLLPSSIHDYLGYPVIADSNSNAGTEIGDFNASPTSAYYNALLTQTDVASTLTNDTNPLNIEPLLAYHYIWRDYYRFTGIQTDVVPTTDSWLENHILNPTFISTAITGTNTINDFAPYEFRHRAQGLLTDSFDSYLGIPYYAHYKKDMFTSVRYGSKPAVLIPTGGSGTIPNLREASAIQKFIDIISITGQRYWDKVKGLWDETPEGMKDERVKFLGRYQAFVKVGEVITTATTNQADTGDYAGRGLLIDGKYIFRRHFTEHGWLMCISSIVPDLHYTGLSRQLTDVNMLDTPVPSLAQVGDQSVKRKEMLYDFMGNTSQNELVLGDQFRYYAYKSAPNEVHGDFKMNTFKAWTAMGKFSYGNNIIDMTRILPQDWNDVFNVTSDTPIFGSRFYLDLTFHEFITRKLPKYVAYSL